MIDIDQVQAQQSLLYISAVDVRDFELLCNRELELLGWSAAAQQWLGLSAVEGAGHGTRLSYLCPGLVDARALHAADQHWVQLRWADGRLRPCRLQVLEIHGPTPGLLLLRLQPVTTESEEPGAQDEDFEQQFGLYPDGVFALDRQGYLLAANAAFARFTGCARDELLHRPLAELVIPDDGPALQAACEQAWRGQPQALDCVCVKCDGQALETAITLLPRVTAGRVTGLQGIARDISQKKSDERRILYLANHDPLTGLPNRNLLQDRMQHAIEQARRQGRQVAVMFMDLNRFKLINDSLGHDQGDLLLRAVAANLSNTLRDGDTVARIGGDEFVVVLEGISSREQVRQVANHLLQAVARPVGLAGTTVSVSTSIGVALFPQDGEDPATLLKNADLAMYSAKDEGQGHFQHYHEEMNVPAVTRLSRENALRRALERGELLLHYQPRMDLARNCICGLEALVRWDDPEKGLIFPGQFIALAEEAGLMESLGAWVLSEACRQLGVWHEEGFYPRLSVNVSPLQLRAGGICAAVRSALAASDVAPASLELEITETSLMHNIDLCSENLQDLRRLGVQLSVDDFGTGYSSLNYLKRLPIHCLKIDKSFVRDLAQDPDDRAIVHATIAMAHSMGLKVVAEGVASLEQLRILEEAQCDEIQGYLLCQPLPVHELEDFVRSAALRGIQYSWPG